MDVSQLLLLYQWLKEQAIDDDIRRCLCLSPRYPPYARTVYQMVRTHLPKALR